jgi:choline dehydrogenase
MCAGHAKDYDHWAESGAHGWSYADVLPYFRRMERWHGGRGDPSWRGHEGPLHVTRGPADNPLAQAFLRAGAGGLSADRGSERRQQEGFGPMEATIWGGRRWSAAWAYLRPALRRVNCDLVPGSRGACLFRRGARSGWRSTASTASRGCSARREVIVTASSINSPKLLMHSASGPRSNCAGGIPVLADRPGVGANLQDHLEMYIQAAR